MKKTVVIYHAHCPDGFGAAWAAQCATYIRDKVFIPCKYGDPVPQEAFTAKAVYILDFSFPSAALIALANAVGKDVPVVLLDHHKSAQKDLSGVLGTDCPSNLVVVFDMEQSGADLAWKHFHPGTPLPPLVAYVQDRDLWQWKLPNSMDISTALSALPFDFQAWTAFNARLDSIYPHELDAVVDEGRSMQRFRDKLISDLCEAPGYTVLKPGFSGNPENATVPVVNSAIWQSEIGNVLAKSHSFAVVWFMRNDGKYVYSLRSDKDRPTEVADVSEIADLFGGGGHRHAAGFVSIHPPYIVPV